MADEQPVTEHPSHAPMSEHPSQAMQQPPPQSGGGFKLDPKALTGPMAGKLKIVTVVVGVVAMAFCAAGYKHQLISNSELYTGSLGSPNCDDFVKCPQVWAAKMALAFVIIAWLFSIISLVLTMIPQVCSIPGMPKVDGFGHLTAGLMAIVAFVLCVLWETTVTNGACNYEGTTGPKANECIKLYLIKSEGHRGYLWLIGGVVGLIYGVMCLVICCHVIGKKARQPNAAGMMTASPSQAPVSQQPSAMGQQQNPEQGSVKPDPSKQTQQEET